MSQLTLLDIAKLNGNDAAIGLIEESLVFSPEIKVFGAKQLKGDKYTIVRRLSRPQVSFRNANEGISASASRFAQIEVKCYNLSSLVKVDRAIADRYEGGAEALQSIEAAGVMEGAAQYIGTQIYYGTGNDAKGFPGLQSLVDSTMTLDATGTTASTGSSVYGVKFGDRGVQLVLGNGATFALGDFRVELALDADNKEYEAYVATLNALVGLQVSSINSVCRIKNITEDSGKGMTDTLGAKALELFPQNYTPDVWLMNRRTRRQLQVSRTATAIAMLGGNKRSGDGLDYQAPTPTEMCGIPIICTDSISKTEAIA